MGMSWNAPEATYLEGSTKHSYKKPGAPVEIQYKTERIEAGEEGTVAIKLITTAKNATMQVSLTLDPQLHSVGGFSTQQSFSLEPVQRSYPLDFVITAEDDGRYYIRLLVKIEGKGNRSFAIPVNVGDVSVHRSQRSVKDSTGENISVSPAQESIIKK